MWRLLASLLLASAASAGQYEKDKCDKRPRTEAPQTPADGRFVLTVEGFNNGRYLPGNNYTVILESDGHSNFFTSFLIMADGEYVEDKNNYRKSFRREAGTLRSKNHGTVLAKKHPYCENAWQQTNNSPKSKVEVEWIAPPKGNGCVTIHAMVAESADVWYMDDPPLSKMVCEDTRRIEDIQPPFVDECGACEEAKYELTFEGQWSRNTHPINFPDAASPRYSDIVGASHSADYYMWAYNEGASSGLKLLAEAGNTTIMEHEIQAKLGCGGVRTVIKASGHGGAHISEPTSAIFRADKHHHLISIATSIVPSPDWFLGVSHFDLCLENNTWVENREYNLYLIDAGTDNGVSYESSNEETLPPGLITPIRKRPDNKNSPFFSSEPGSPRQFGKLRVSLMRLFRETCESSHVFRYEPEHDHENGYQSPISHEETDQGNGESNFETTIRSEDTTPLPNESCPISDWHEWTECTPRCGPVRYRYRERYHLVNGVEFRYNRENRNLQPPPLECVTLYADSLFQSESCEPNICPIMS